MLDELEFKKWFNRVVKNSGEKIESSEVFLSIFSKNFKENPQCALELGIAVMLGKPIFLVVTADTEVPKTLERLAEKIEYLKDDSKEEMNRAMTSISMAMNP